MKNNTLKTLLTPLLVTTSLLGQAQTNYNFDKMQREKLNRGVIAIKSEAKTAMVSWRYLSSDPMGVAFNVYRDGVKRNSKPITEATLFYDTLDETMSGQYEVRPVVKKKEQPEEGATYTLKSNAPIGYLEIPLNTPPNMTMPNGETCRYIANDASLGDVDGDGEYEIILKWEPSNARDNSHDGFTGNVLFDAYKLNGEQLWRIDLGHNIRAGAHYTQFMVYDFDGDGCAEIALKTADGTIDGTGVVIGDSGADHRNKPKEALEARQQPRGQRQRQWLPRHGQILTGPEYLTIFEGKTGRAMQTIDYEPARGNTHDWGDNYGNRSDRYLACVAYLDGIRPSLVMCRGYYTRSVLAAYDWDGTSLQKRWIFDSNTPGNESYAGQGNHNLRVGDVDGDGCDEIVYGACVINHDGTGLYNTNFGHGDAIHLTAFFPNSDKLQVWSCQENKRDGSILRDAATGEVIWQKRSGRDVGRCMAADIDPTNKGLEMWSLDAGELRNVAGEEIRQRPDRLSFNMAVWWDGDLLRELLDRNVVSKYNWETNRCDDLQIFDGCSANNSSKNTPCLQGDIIGDWREEVLMRTNDSSALRLYVSTLPTDYRFHTFLEDPVYRISIATQNVSYNQPTQPGFYFGSDFKPGSVVRGTKIK